jgi:hypothetical protein
MLTFFLAINAHGTSSGGGGSGDRSSGESGARAAVGSSGSVGAAVSSVHVCGSRGQRPGAQSRWMAGNQCGRQPACLQQQSADAVSMGQRAAAAACVRQRAAAAACVRQRAGAASNTITMGDSDGSGQPAAQLQWVVAAAAQRRAGWRQDSNGQRRQ